MNAQHPLRLWSRRHARRWGRLRRLLSFVWRALARQESLLFRPSATDHGNPIDVGLAYEEHRLLLGGDELRLWWVESGRTGPCVLFLPGAVGNMSYELGTLLYLHRLGASVCMLDYSGFGGSSGRAGARACFASALAAWRYMDARGVDLGASIVYGRSVGASVAVWLAAHATAPRLLVLQNGFGSAVDLVARRIPRRLARLLCRIPLEIRGWAGQVVCDVVLIHARQDALVPPEAGAALASMFRARTRVVEVAGGHFGHAWCYEPQLRALWTELLASADSLGAAAVGESRQP